MSQIDEFWVYIGHEVSGPFEVPALWTIAGFGLQSLVCRQGEGEWSEARLFPSIVAYSEGRWTPEEPGQTSHHKTRNWREAVIPADFEQASVAAAPNAAAVMMDVPAIARSSITPAAAPSGLKRFFFDRRDKRLLMVFFWLMAVRVYSPHWGDLGNLYDNLTMEPAEQIGPVRNVSIHPNRGRVKVLSRTKRHEQRLAAAKAAVIAAAAAAVRAPASRPARVTRKVIDESTEYMGDGTIMKVRVIVTEKNGVKTFETKRQFYQDLHGHLKPL